MTSPKTTPAPEHVRISRAILDALDRENPILFLGAGVGVRVGYPTWATYLEYLATECEKWDDHDAALLIRSRVSRGSLPTAASVYKTCDMIPAGERLTGLAAPFQGELPETMKARLVPLVALPFTAIVTTNYDHSIQQACVKRGRWALPVELNDGTLRGATLQRDFFLARIHGRADAPESMVVSDEDYRNLRGNDAYIDFLLDLLRTRSCCFVGFSFLDPAIQEVLALYEERVTPNFNSLHCALIPKESDDLATRLLAVNIQAIVYDSADEHAALWRGIRHALDATQRPRVARVRAPVAGLQRFMAFAYAQVRLKDGERQGASQIVEDGIVLSLLSDSPSSRRDPTEMAHALRPILRLTDEEALAVLSRATERLVARKQISRIDGQFALSVTVPSLLDRDLKTLASAVEDRVLVRDGVRLQPTEVEAVGKVLESCLLTRAWDLAAHYAGATTGFGGDVGAVVHDLVQRQVTERHMRPAVGPAVERGVADLLHYPEDAHAGLLGRLSRAAFGLQLVLSTPRQVLFQQFALPQRLYLDANVVMPAITSGHPLQITYAGALRQLSETAASAGGRLQIIVGEQFLNEVVAHRRIAVDIVRELDLQAPKELDRQIALHGSLNVNVFVAAFATHVRETGDAPQFGKFLEDVAPYETEGDLAAHLRGMGIAAEALYGGTGNGQSADEIFADLLSIYEKADKDGIVRGKEKILVRHEAQQLARLALDEHTGLRSVFVTADERLRRVLRRVEKLRRFAGMTMARLGLVALVDVMVGLDTDDRSLVRLMWASTHTSEQTALLDYFVRMGLLRYEEGAAVEMQEAARKVAAELSSEAEKKKVELLNTSLDQVVGARDLLERYEDRFFKYWREAIDRRERLGR